MADHPLFAFAIVDFATTNGGMIPPQNTDGNVTPTTDFTVTNGGVTDGVQWPSVQMPASVGGSSFFFRTARSGPVLELTQNQPAVISVFMQDIESGQGLAGLAPTMVVLLKKSNAAFASSTPTITDRTLGWYDLSFLAASFDTLGEGTLHITGPGAQPNDETKFKVIALNKDDGVRAGLTALPNVAAGSLGGLPTNAIRTGTAQGAGNGVNQIQLDAGATSQDGFYSRATISIIAGLGAGQSRFIASYAGGTRMASVNKNWGTQPDATSVFEIVSSSNSLLTEGLAQAGTANTITFRANDSAQDDLYKDQWVHITSGTGSGQTRLVTGYVGATKIVTVDKNWKINPDATSVYQILTGADVAGVPTAASIRDAILDAARSGHLIPGTIGEGIALATSLLQGNFFIDEVDNSDPNGPTSQRLRCFVDAAAMASITPGGSGEGEFATFVVTTTYEGPNKITTHQVVQQ
jgi:hypothetical protein